MREAGYFHLVGVDFRSAMRAFLVLVRCPQMAMRAVYRLNLNRRNRLLCGEYRISVPVLLVQLGPLLARHADVGFAAFTLVDCVGSFLVAGSTKPQSRNRLLNRPGLHWHLLVDLERGAKVFAGAGVFAGLGSFPQVRTISSALGAISGL